MTKKCGALTRAGGKCKKAAIEKSGRCKHHGGMSTGPKNPEKLKGNQNARKHGIYSSTYSEEEIEIADAIKLGSLDDEIILCRIRLGRALIAEQEIVENPQDDVIGFELSQIEIQSMDGEASVNDEAANDRGDDDPGDIKKPWLKTISKRPDYRTIITQLISLIAKLERERKNLAGKAPPPGGTGVLRMPMEASSDEEWEAAAQKQQADLRQRVED